MSESVKGTVSQHIAYRTAWISIGEATLSIGPKSVPESRLDQNIRDSLGANGKF